MGEGTTESISLIAHRRIFSLEFKGKLFKLEK